MRANSFNTGIASEYLVLSKLYRLELEAYISQGNKKSVDIRVIRESGIPISIDVKSVRGYSSLVINNVEPKDKHFIIFVIYNNKFEDLTVEPEIFIVPSIKIPSITETYGKEKRVLKGKLTDFKDQWHYISDGYGEDGWLMDEEEEQWIDFVNCHGEIIRGNSIPKTLKKYNIAPHLFLQLQNKLSADQHVDQISFDKQIFDTYETSELSTLLEIIRSQNEKGEAQRFGDRVENELKRRNTIT
jgi:hypothetical protein